MPATLLFGSNAIVNFECSDPKFAIQMTEAAAEDGKYQKFQSAEESGPLRALDGEMRADYLPRQVPSTTSSCTMTLYLRWATI